MAAPADAGYDAGMDEAATNGAETGGAETGGAETGGATWAAAPPAADRWSPSGVAGDPADRSPSGPARDARGAS